MKILRGLTVFACVVALGACSGQLHKLDEVEALNDAQAVGSPFTQRLTAEYTNFVNVELDDMGDRADALHFSRKGLASARGDIVAPEQIADWNLNLEQIQELNIGRGRLMNVFNLGAREIEPDLSAVAQARYDCWIEQEEENFQPAHINACKKEFLDALQQLEAALQNRVPPPAPEPAPVAEPFDVDPAEPMKAEDAVYLVFFDFDKHNLTSGAQSVLDAVAQEVQNRPVNMISIVGHADTSGARAYNRKLAMKRANRIRDALVQRGVDPNVLRVESRGEEDLLVQTADDVREPANRRGEITFQ